MDFKETTRLHWLWIRSQVSYELPVAVTPRYCILPLAQSTTPRFETSKPASQPQWVIETG